jgi:hypothetical protein
VRVSNIEPRPGFVIWAEIEEIRSPGLWAGDIHIGRRLDIDWNQWQFVAALPGGGSVSRSLSSAPPRWRISASSLKTFCTHSWHPDYGGQLLFSPDTVQAVVDFAARFPNNADSPRNHLELLKLLINTDALAPSEFVFPDAAEDKSGKFRTSDLPANAVQASSGWVTCPYCDIRFALYNPSSWDGEKHKRCGQRLIIDAT